ncbi:MAG TPA: NAD(P)-dependent oxidoreductase [Stellaceae bacterium]|nr:NAD(P)-dependent oxidoreductase [Stellaceae bacterium]
MLPISVDVAHIHVMLVGDGAVARRRLALLDEAGAEALEIYAPDPGPELAAMAGARLRQRFPLPAEIARAQLVFVAGVPQLVASDICRVANAAGVLVNVEDNRRRSDFHSAAVIRRGDLTVAISTNGKSPGLASLMRRVLEHRVGPEWELRLDQIAALRQAWRAAGADPATIGRRTQEWVAREGWLDPAAREPSQEPPQPIR